MKKSFISIFAATLILAACSGHSNKEHDHNDGTHTHDDGSVHQNHDSVEIKQEEFTLSNDTLSK